jgi:hypothetical protein
MHSLRNLIFELSPNITPFVLRHAHTLAQLEFLTYKMRIHLDAHLP